MGLWVFSFLLFCLYAPMRLYMRKTVIFSFRVYHQHCISRAVECYWDSSYNNSSLSSFLKNTQNWLLKSLNLFISVFDCVLKRWTSLMECACTKIHFIFSSEGEMCTEIQYFTVSFATHNPPNFIIWHTPSPNSDQLSCDSQMSMQQSVSTVCLYAYQPVGKSVHLCVSFY